MTAEISILNKSAVALAADSAATVQSDTSTKIYNTVNKLFNLNKKYPIGIMIYGAAEFLSVPWETIIKEYRLQNAEREYFNTIKEEADHFIKFISDNINSFPIELQTYNFSRRIKVHFRFINNDIVKKVEEKTKINGTISEDETINIINKYVDKRYNYFKEKIKYINGFTDEDNDKLQLSEEKEILKIKDEIFQKLPLGEEIIKKLKYIAISATLKEYFLSSVKSGIVIAGFGKIEFFPSIVHCEIEGAFQNKLRLKLSPVESISINTPSSITSYAQTDMAAVFLEGINPLYKRAMNLGFDITIKKYNDQLNDILKQHITDNNIVTALSTQLKTYNKQLFTDLLNDLQTHAQNEHINPIVQSISNLPKEELAIMAETLVYLTYLKRRFSEEEETVGGDIDVAIITKGDGFIWIKRKHYFKPELNPHFFNNNYK